MNRWIRAGVAKRVFVFGWIICMMACSSPTAPSPQTYTASLTPYCFVRGCEITDAQAFAVSSQGVITATLTSVTPTPEFWPIRLVIGTPISPPQPGYGIHDCNIDDARYEVDYMPVRPAGLILPGRYANTLPASITRPGSSGSYCVVVENYDRAVASTVTLSISTN